MQLFKLRFHSALHVDSKGSGAPEVADDFVRSDTLAAALSLAWATLYSDVDDDFFLNPPFAVSSAFPYMDETLLFPVPAWPVWTHLNDAQRKDYKKVRWLSQDVFVTMLRQKPIAPDQIHLAHGVAIFKTEIAAHPTRYGAQPWVIDERQRVHVDRLGLPTEGGLFFFALQFFAPWSGLWFLAQGAPEVLQKLRGVLDYLGDTGIGADRNSGLGHFQVVETAEFTPPEVSGQGYLTLSLFNPGASDDLTGLLRHSAYGITSRSGWISHSTIGRPPIRVFTEGSYFSKKPVGRVTPMLPAELRQRAHLQLHHSAPRDFRAIWLSCAEPPGLKEEPL